ncbi:MAGUK p55 subfamily member 4 [Grus japonensis]|uniref:MAGUK p55 subfamily member 4 n=1 Tax=Grus japonensis TaxID=30415 RepID=A0ABC9X276_GRUJA
MIAADDTICGSISHVLTLVLQELSLLCKRDVNGVGMLYDLLRSRWLQALLKVVELLREAPQSGEIKELRRLLRAPHLKALLSAHDTVAQKDFEPTLPPLPDNIPENEEAMRIVCLVKNNQPLGATIKRHEITGDITVARVIHGGLADRSEDDMQIDEKCVETAGFRRSMRLCRRKSRTNQQSCYARCPSSCYSTLAAPYEEVVRYQRHPADRSRLIILVDTTRVQKSYEMNGREYHYVSKETFENMVYSHRMLEYGEYKGYLYGTSIDAVRTVLDEGKICVIDLEPQVMVLINNRLFFALGLGGVGILQ